MRTLSMLFVLLFACYDGPAEDAPSQYPAPRDATAPPLGDPGDDSSDAAPPDPTPSADASVDAPVRDVATDALPDAPCTRRVAAGDLIIDEIMIASVAGSGDRGEWLEVASTSGCAIDLRGLHAECARGAKVATVDVADALWLPPHGMFVIADSSDPAINHYLPGIVLTWLGEPADVLRNQGATITLRLGDTLLESATYPALKLSIGASLAFPSGCDPTTRSDWARWRSSTASWFPGFRGTPNAPNSDVACP